MSKGRLKGHPILTAKYEAEGRARPVDPLETPAALPLHYQQGGEENRVVLDASGAPALHHVALDFISRGDRLAPWVGPQRDYLTVSEVAKLLKIAPITVRSSIQKGHMPAEQPAGPGGFFRIPVEPFEQYLARQGYSVERRAALRERYSPWLRDLRGE
jgi:excisionase family DNA binding protein